jgi:hypothetical protein
MKISVPRDKPKFDARRNHRRGPGSKTFFHNVSNTSGQKPQSPILEWKEFSKEKKKKILRKLRTK